MESKKILMILAIFLVAAVALGSVSAAEDIAGDTLAIDDVAEVEEVSEAPAVAEVEEAAPSDEVVESISDEVVEPRTITNHRVNSNNWTDFDFTQGNVVVDFDNEFYGNFNIAQLGDYTTLNGNGATLIGNGNTVIDISNTQGVSINGFNIFINDYSQNGIAGSYVYDANIYNNHIFEGDDGINIFRDWNNVSVYGNTIFYMNRDAISFANPTHDDLSTLNGAYIYDNTIYNSEFGIFVGSNFNGEIYNNAISDVVCGMQFGKAKNANGTLIAYVHDNNISAEIGIDMCHPGVVNFTLARNSINGTNMSIDTNGSFAKTSDGGIYLYNNTLNGDVCLDFIGSITEAIGNDGTGAYNN